MDVAYLKLRIDIKAEYKQYRKQYEYAKKEIKKDEIKDIFDSFKEFFKRDGSFKFKENEHSVTAEYKDHAIVLDIDVYKNLESTDFIIEGDIETFEGETFEFLVIAVCSKEEPEVSADYESDEQDKMLHATTYYKEFLDEKIIYQFKYTIKDREQEFNTMQELMLAL